MGALNGHLTSYKMYKKDRKVEVQFVFCLFWLWLVTLTQHIPRSFHLLVDKDQSKAM